MSEALEADELAASLAVALKSAQDDAVRLLAPPPSDAPPPTVPTRVGHWRELQAKNQLTSAESIAALHDYLDSLDKAQRERVRVSWRVEDKD